MNIDAHSHNQRLSQDEANEVSTSGPSTIWKSVSLNFVYAVSFSFSFKIPQIV